MALLWEFTSIHLLLLLSKIGKSKYPLKENRVPYFSWSFYDTVLSLSVVQIETFCTSASVTNAAYV